MAKKSIIIDHDGGLEQFAPLNEPYPEGVWVTTCGLRRVDHVEPEGDQVGNMERYPCPMCNPGRFNVTVGFIHPRTELEDLQQEADQK